MSAPDLLSDAQVAEFHRNGVLVVPSFYDPESDILPIQHAVYRVIGQVMKRHSIPDARPAFSMEHFDDGYQSLIALDRSYGSQTDSCFCPPAG